MKSKNNWLPGCYRNLPIKTGESLPGYLLRLAEANGYAGIRHLLLATGLWESTSGYSFRLRTQPDLLTTLGRMATGDLHYRRDGSTWLFCEGRDSAVGYSWILYALIQLEGA